MQGRIQHSLTLWGVIHEPQWTQKSFHELGSPASLHYEFVSLIVLVGDNPILHEQVSDLINICAKQIVCKVFSSNKVQGLNGVTANHHSYNSAAMLYKNLLTFSSQNLASTSSFSSMVNRTICVKSHPQMSSVNFNWTENCIALLLAYSDRSLNLMIMYLDYNP